MEKWLNSSPHPITSVAERLNVVQMFLGSTPVMTIFRSLEKNIQYYSLSRLMVTNVTDIATMPGKTYL